MHGLRCSQEIQSSTRLLDRILRKVDSPATDPVQLDTYFRNVAEAVAAFVAAAAQARALRGAAGSPAAELLQVRPRDRCHGEQCFAGPN